MKIGINKQRSEPAFDQLEDKICDLTRMGTIADQQLHRAVGELTIVDGKYTEVPDCGETELAVFAVEKMRDMAKELKALWYRLHDEAYRHS